MLARVLRSRVLIVRVAAAAAALTLLIVLLLGRSYTTVSSFIPEARRGSSNISGLAAQLGVQVGSGDLSQSPQFYADLVGSDEILRRAAGSTFAVSPEDTTNTVPLAVATGVGGSDSLRSIAAAMRWLRGHVSASAQDKTGVVTVTVTTKSAALSAALNARLLALVNEFNLATRQSQAAAERKFAGAQVDELGADLRQAEDTLTRFLQRNRGDLRTAPDLAFQQDRLSREVQLRQQVYSSMVQAYEQAKLDEVRDTPVITILDRPRVPFQADSRGLLWKLIFAFGLGAVVAAMWVVVRDGINSALWDAEPHADELRLVVLDSLADVRRPWRLLVGPRRTRSQR